MRTRIAATVVLILASLFTFTAPQPTASQGARAAEQCFPETGKCISGRFYDYWLDNGGLRQQGLPISDEFNETNPTDGKIYKTQYFERARFELHPENVAPYDVLLGLLGREQYQAQHGGGQPGGGASPSPSTALFEANWANGRGNWAGGSDWKVANGQLVNDGTSRVGASFLLAPAQTPTSNYAVEADIQILNATVAGGAAAGITVRREQNDQSGYMGGWIDDGSSGSLAAIGVPDTIFFLGPDRQKAFTPGTSWHTYRLEVRGSAVRLLIDGALMLEFSNDQYPAGTSTSLWSRGAQINVRSFRIVAI